VAPSEHPAAAATSSASVSTDLVRIMIQTSRFPLPRCRGSQSESQ
jgi:hypothetical protein